MTILTYDGGQVPAILDIPAVLQIGRTADLSFRALDSRCYDGTLSGPGLGIGTAGRPVPVRLPGTYRLTAPADTLPGIYQIRLQGEDFFEVKRYVEVI